MPEWHVEVGVDIAVRSAVVVQMEVATGGRVLVGPQHAAPVELDVAHRHEWPTEPKWKDLLEGRPVRLLVRPPLTPPDRFVAHDATMSKDALQDHAALRQIHYGRLVRRNFGGRAGLGVEDLGR